jgi:hypothetical protein
MLLSTFFHEEPELVFLYDATRALYQDTSDRYEVASDIFSILFVKVAADFCEFKDVELQEQNSISLYYNVRLSCRDNERFLSASDALRVYVEHGEESQCRHALAWCFSLGDEPNYENLL